MSSLSTSLFCQAQNPRLKTKQTQRWNGWILPHTSFAHSPSLSLTLTVQSSNLIPIFSPALLSPPFSRFHLSCLPVLRYSLTSFLPLFSLFVSLLLALAGLWLGHCVPVTMNPSSTCGAACKCSLTCFAHDWTKHTDINTRWLD